MIESVFTFVMHEVVYFGAWLPFVVMDLYPGRFLKYKIQKVGSFVVSCEMKGYVGKEKSVGANEKVFKTIVCKPFVYSIADDIADGMGIDAAWVFDGTAIAYSVCIAYGK